MPDQLTAADIREQFESLGLRRGGSLYYTPPVALEIIAACRANDLCILGFEGFEITEAATIPEMDLISDYSPDYSQPWRAHADLVNRAAVTVIAGVQAKPNLMFWLGLLDRHPYELRYCLNILVDFLDGQIALADVQVRLREFVSFDFTLAPNERTMEPNRLSDEFLRIAVAAQPLRHMLQNFQAGLVSEIDLSNWAAFIFMAQAYVPMGDTEEERWQAGNGPVWDILQQLMTPALFGGLGQQRISEYLHELDILTGKVS